MRPSDVVKAHSGKTIEIVNTDAEGRLILADALSYVKRFKPAAVLDAATLTGARAHRARADGERRDGQRRRADRGGAAGRRALRRAGLAAADVRRVPRAQQVGHRRREEQRRPLRRGTITAGWFLREFVEGYPWVHLDVAGTAYTGSDAPPLAKGPAGVPMRLFVEFLLGRAG